MSGHRARQLQRRLEVSINDEISLASRHLKHSDNRHINLKSIGVAVHGVTLRAYEYRTLRRPQPRSTTHAATVTVVRWDDRRIEVVGKCVLM
jgi:hypothetical protein